MKWQQTENVELDPEIDSKSAETDFYFSYLTIDTDDDDGFEQPAAPEESIEGNIEFNEDASLELYEIAPLPTLQHLTASVLAIELWRRVISCENANRMTCSAGLVEDFLSKEYKNVEELSQRLPLPSLIREFVRNYFKPVREELYEWIEYYCDFISMPLRISDLMQCVWLSDGKIDHRKTALNMLSTPGMDISNKFRIMSKYCLEDEIKKLSPDAIPERFTRRIKFDKDPLQYYWLCYMNKNFDKFPVKNGQSVEAFMISSVRLNTRSALQYFWNHLNVNEQISAALKQLKEWTVFEDIQTFQRWIFSKMNQFQKYHVLSTIPFQTIEHFYSEELYQLAFFTAIRFGNLLTFENFTDLISDLLIYSVCNDDKHDAMLYLVKIWNYFPDDYKNQAFQSLTEEVIDLHCKPVYDHDTIEYPINPDFLVVFLSSGSVDFRRWIIFDHGAALVLSCEPSAFDPVIRLCIPDAKDQARFEKYLLHSDIIESYCLAVLDGLEGDLKQLADFLNQYISNSRDIREFIGRILKSSESKFLVLSDPIKRWNNAIEFGSYLKNACSSQIQEYRNAMVWIFIQFYAQCKYDYKIFPQFIQIITGIIEEDLLEYYKTLALEKFCSQCCWVKFDKLKVHQFLLWCLNYDYMEMKRFVKSLSIDSIFWDTWKYLKRDRFFEEERSRQEISVKLAPIDEILLWYFFGKSDCVKEFKLGKVFFGFADGRPEMFVKNNAVDEVFAKNLLPWFFDGNREEISKFTKLYENDSISKFIHID